MNGRPRRSWEARPCGPEWHHRGQWLQGTGGCGYAGEQHSDVTQHSVPHGPQRKATVALPAVALPASSAVPEQVGAADLHTQLSIVAAL